MVMVRVQQSFVHSMTPPLSYRPGALRTPALIAPVVQNNLRSTVRTPEDSSSKRFTPARCDVVEYPPLGEIESQRLAIAGGKKVAQYGAHIS